MQNSSSSPTTSEKQSICHPEIQNGEENEHLASGQNQDILEILVKHEGSYFEEESLDRLDTDSMSKRNII